MKFIEVFPFIISIIIVSIVLIVLLACKPFSKNTLKDEDFETHY